MSQRSILTIHSRQRGFTLAEILVTTAIFAIIMLAALAVYDQSNKTFKTSTESADMQQSTRVGFEKLVSDVRMAGFDYSRGGTPTDPGTWPQPDEQIEYAGASAVVFRANFNYNSPTGTDNGVEKAYEPVNVNGQYIFPYVTTSNDEIVAYVVRSTDSTKNNSSISFYADVTQPRSAFPASITPAPAATNPSKKEDKVTISGIDTTNQNPPYTLYRMTVTDVKNNALGTPVAENIRSLNFIYYSDAQGTTSLRDSAGATIPAGCTDPNCTGAIGGDGQYDPNAPNFQGAGNFADRAQRAQIQSIRVNLVGLNASPDLQGYTNPTETVASIQSYRQYALSSLVVPRNLGKQGFPEPTNSPPAPPQIVNMCTGYCGAPVIYWTAPTGGGPVMQYLISWDTNPNGSFAAPHQVYVNNPNATSYNLPDTFSPADDLSATWYYRIQAINNNGASSPSNLFTAVPKNHTKPSPPTSFAATDNSLGNAQANQITLSWTSPTTNDTPNTLSCGPGVGSTDGSMIPSGEVVKFRIWRGTRADFDPRPGCSSGPQCQGVAVLRLTSGSQPPGAIPGSNISWIDNALNEQLPAGGQQPAACTQYYYRIQAVDRCVNPSSGAYQVSGNIADSESTFFPAINGSNNARPGSAAATSTTPQTPLGLTAPGGPSPIPLSGCPDPANPTSSYCSIVLQWNTVTNDTSGNAIGVDTYRITRKVKHLNNIPSSGYTLDTTFGGGTGMMDVSGFSQIAPNSNGKAQWIDTTALVADPAPPFMGSAYSYEYTIAAKTCTTYSPDSNVADFPTPCTINPTIIEAGASNPTASGDTPAQAWIMNAGDTITVSPPSGATFQSVNFNVTTWPAGAPVDNQTVNTPGPYVYTWSDRQDLQIYQVTITVTEATPNAGCQEVHIKYVQDQAAAPCAFSVVNPVPAPAITTSGSNSTATNSFSIKNNGTDPMQFNIVSGSGSPFQGTIRENWADPTGGLHPSLTATAFVYSYPGPPAYSNSDNFLLITPLVLRSVPSSLPNIAPATTLTLQVKWSYKKTEPALTATPLQKLCIAYKIPSEPATTKFCNLVGQSATTNNPNACD
jgi:prepilin-type N-terminal cleavage/methylation domain-containing protein